MRRFNLLDEPWIMVFEKEKGVCKEVSMTELFRNAADYTALAGEMETQNFAVMRFLLAALQTVFSRLDFDGKPLPGVKLSEEWLQTEIVDEDCMEEYILQSDRCWEKLYAQRAFPQVIFDYLEKWKDRFYLFDEEYPLMQVTKKEMDSLMARIPGSRKPTVVYGKTINRTISESENKAALFSPIQNEDDKKRGVKDIMTEAQFARWLLTYHGYTGLSDKISVVGEGQRPSKGWLFDIGGIYLRGDDLFKTLVMNLLLGSAQQGCGQIGGIQKPCWEESGMEAVDRLCRSVPVKSIAELYTLRSRAVFVSVMLNTAGPMEMNVVKIPEIDHKNAFTEPMTLWRWNTTGPNAGSFTPRKHVAGQALWRSFSSLSGIVESEDGTGQHRPGILNQLGKIAKAAGNETLDVVGISMQDDGNATSWLAVDEIKDCLRINDKVIADMTDEGWAVRISAAAETTRAAIYDYGSFLRGVCTIRGLRLTDPADQVALGFIEREIMEMYETIDPLFRDWLYSIDPDEPKDEKIAGWYEILKKHLLSGGEQLFNNATERDLKGIHTDSGCENIATKYYQFVGRIRKRLGMGGKL